MKVTAARIEASLRIAAIRKEQIASHIAAIRQDAIDSESAISAARFRELQAGSKVAPRTRPGRGEAKATQAARWAKEYSATLTRAALVFGVPREVVAIAWERLGYPTRWQT